MPFKSEKQRRYLWANEPEIARDWADTYGSKIKKAEGGITRIPFKKGGWDPGAGRDKRGYQSSHGQYQGGGDGAQGKGASHHHSVDTPAQKKGQAQADADNRRMELNRLARLDKEQKREELVEKFRHKKLNDPMHKAMNYVPYIGTLNRMVGPLGNRRTLWWGY
jgi:hypothetical protein